MLHELRLNIISLKGIQYEGEATSLNLKTTAGELTVLDNHQSLMTVLAPGRVIITKKDDERLEINIVSGFLEVGEGNQVTILAR